MYSFETKRHHVDRKKSTVSYNYETDPIKDSSPCVMESSSSAHNDRNIEKTLNDILAKLERIEKKIDESVYPPETTIQPAYIRKVKVLNTKVKKGTKKTYSTMDDFIRNLKQ